MKRFALIGTARLFVFLGILAVGMVVMISPVQAFSVTADTVRVAITAIEGDWTGNEDPIFFDDSNKDGVANIVLDFGESRVVDKIKHQNRIDVATNFAATTVEILVAPDETASGFNPTLAASYTINVFSGQLTPVTNAANVVRYADITDVTRRYFLIKYTGNFWGSPLPASANHIQAGDLAVQSVVTLTPHTHAIGDVTGLADALDGKANVSDVDNLGDVVEALQAQVDALTAEYDTHVHDKGSGGRMTGGPVQP